MFYRQGEVLGRVERRRRFSLEQKLSILAEACAPGAVISAVARRHGRLAALGVIGIPGASELPSFVAVEVAADTAEGGTVPANVPAPLESVPATLPPASLGQDRPGVIEIDLGGGRCVRVMGAVDVDALRRVLDVLDGR
jgi:transposase